MIRIAYAMLLLPGLASAQVGVLGVQLGAKFDVDGQCSAKPKSKSACWVGRPFKASDGSKSGMVILPNPDSRPVWAAYGPFNAVVNKAGVIERLQVDSQAVPWSDVAASIRGRFGLPSSVTNLPSDGIHAAEWVTPEITVKMLCRAPQECRVQFISGVVAEAVRSDIERRGKARPASP